MKLLSGTPQKGKSAHKKKQPENSVQALIPYKAMYPDGICLNSDGRYSKCVRFMDITYHMLEEVNQQEVMQSWCRLLDFFDSNTYLQLSIVKRRIDVEAQKRLLAMPECDSEFADLSREYEDIIETQLKKGSGFFKALYLTFSVAAASKTEAQLTLSRIEADVLSNFSKMGVAAYPLNGKDRLAFLHGWFNASSGEPFRFDYGMLPKSGQSTKDYIAPTSFNVTGGHLFRMGKTFGASSYLNITADDLTDELIDRLLEINDEMIFSLQIKPLDKQAALKKVKSVITDLDRMKMDEQKKAVRSGYDMDILPNAINSYSTATYRLRDDLELHNERMYLVTPLLTIISPNKAHLESNIQRASGIAQQASCVLRRLDFRQLEGMFSCLPFAYNQIPIERAMNTSALGVFIPFSLVELFQTSSNALYYGMHSISHNIIVADRRENKNPNGLIFGSPGSGKSFAAKREFTNVFLRCPNDTIFVCDPESEYAPLIENFHGQVIRIAANSHDYLNPLDISVNYSEDDNPLQLKSEFILSLFELILEKGGIEGEGRSIIDQAIRHVYQPYLLDPVPENVPILEDMYNFFMQHESPRAKSIGNALEIYVHGSLSVFNHRSTVDTSNRIICFDIKDLGKSLKKLGMLIVQDQVWCRVAGNRNKKRHTWFFIDEFHLLLKEPQTAAYSVEIWKRFRKWGGIPTGITQNVSDLMDSREIHNILENSEFIYMLSQSADARAILAKTFDLSEKQCDFITNSAPGEGLLRFGELIIPFYDRFPQDTKLYQMMNTRLEA